MQSQQPLFVLLTGWAARHLALLVLAAVPLSASASDNLYDTQFGGKSGMQKIVSDTIARSLADPRISDFFADSDIPRLEAVVAEQLCELTGGPCKYSGKSMREAHKDFAIRTAHFNYFAEHLQAAMRTQGVPNWAQNRLLAKLAPMHRDIARP